MTDAIQAKHTNQAESQQGLERISPWKAGVNPRDVLDFLTRIEERRIHLHSFMMLKGDKVFAEGSYAPCQEKDLHMLFSMSKSFTSTAVGFAVQEGRLSLEDRVVDFFREELQGKEEAVQPHMRTMTVRHLLTMNTGQTDAEDALFQDSQADWCLRFLTSPVEKEPGSWFLYNTRASYMLSAILDKVTGESLMDYLKPRLFQPLDFTKGIWWERSPQGICAGGFGLNISVEDLAKFGVFIKNKGNYKGKQLLSPEWFEEATRSWSDTSNTWTGENAYGYGYQFWMCHIPGTYRGDGAFGQYCVILPREDMLFITTAGELDMQKILDSFWETVYKGQIASMTETGEILPSGKRQEGEAKESSLQELEKRLSHLVLPTYYEEKGMGGMRLRLPEGVSGKRYLLEENTLHIRALRLIQDETETDECLLELQNGACTSLLTLSPKDWIPGTLALDSTCTELEKSVFRAGLFSNCHVKGCTKDNVLYLDMLFQETSFQDTWEISFSGSSILLDIKRNTGFVPANIHVKGVAE